MTAAPTRRAALLSAVALAGCGRGGKTAAAPPPLRVGTYKGQDGTLLPAAGQASTPYPLRWSEFASGNLITEAILAGALDMGGMSDIPPIFVAAAKPAMKLVAVLRGDVNNQVVLVPKDSPIHALAQLKGKRIGYVKATTSHYILLKLLEEQHLTWGDITPVALGPTDGRAAFEGGRLDAWVIFGAVGQLARATAGARVLTTGLGRLSGNYAIAASDAALADAVRRGQVADYLKRLKAAYAWAEAQPDSWIRAVSAATGVPEAIYRQQRAERSAPTRLEPVDAQAVTAEQAIADTFAAAGLIPAKVDVASLWNRSFASALS